MNDVAIFDFDLAVHPVHWSLFGIKFLDDLVLFSAVLSFDFIILDLLKLDEFCFVFQASQLDFIASQMDDGIWEDVDDFCKDLFHKFVSLIETNIQRAHVPIAEGASNVFVLRGQSPTGCMTWGVQLGYNSDTSDHGVSDEFPCVGGGVSLLLTESSVLSDFRV